MKDPRAEIIETAGKCLYCGFCEALCPTRPLGPHRGYGPRGRVNIAYMLAKGEIVASSHVVESLYSCLLCRACELKCPIALPIAEIIRNARGLIAEPGLNASKSPSINRVQVFARRT
ncbi:MAG: (Fe-S)-binding protein [Desulfurococcales archaeon]|nr:(Fe-S)-binding protein [Desulfurococcales archaeon]